MRPHLTLSIVAALFMLTPALHAQSALETDDQKTLYALGLAVSQNLGQLELSADELATVQRGIADGVMQREPQVDMATYGPRIQEFAQQRISAAADAEKATGAAFLTEQAAAAGAVTTDSGLIITEMTAGTGASPAATDTVTVHYHGTLRDGTVFDSSVDRGEPATFPLSQVIPCWTEGVQLIKVGGKSRLVCPADLAYGDQGRPGIPGGATLVFEVELIGVGD